MSVYSISSMNNTACVRIEVFTVMKMVFLGVIPMFLEKHAMCIYKAEDGNIGIYL